MRKGRLAPTKNQYLRAAGYILVLAFCYSCAGKFGLSLASVNPSASAVWPPSGIALAALLLWGYRLWPGIFLGAFLVNITTQGNIATTLGIASGNTLEALLGAWLVGRFANGAKAFERARNIFKFVLLAAVLSTVVSATFGVTSLSLGGFAQWEHYPAIWLTWWLGDVVGDLIITPLLVIWLKQAWPQVNLKGIVEAAGVALAAVLAGQFLFMDTFAGAEYFAIPPLLWAAFRFGERGAVTTAFVMSGIALVGTLRGLGPFATLRPDQSLLFLQALMGTLTVMALVLASVVSEHKRVEQRLLVQDAVSRILAESPALREASPKIVQVLCERAGWEIGAIWDIDRTANELACVEVWHLPSITAPEFEAITRQRRFTPGVGLPGRVWGSGKPAWIPDVTKDGNFPRAPIASKEGLHAAFGFPIRLGDEILGVVECFSREVREPDDHFLQMVGDIGGQLGRFIERKQAESEIVALNNRLASDLANMTRLQQVSSRLVQTEELTSLLHEIVDVAMEITGADRGIMQLFERKSGALKIVAHRGFEAPLLEFFDTVHDGFAACGAAMQRGERVIVEDVATDPIFAGSAACDVLLTAGVRAVQSTPLISRSGRLVGMFSTHHRTPCRPSERELGLLDLLARQAADLIERTQTEAIISESEERLRAVVETAVDGIITIDEHGVISTVNPAAERIFGYAASEIIGQNVRVLMPEPYRAEHDSYIHNYLRTGQRKIIGIGREVQGRRRDSTSFPLELAVSETRLGEHRIFTGIVRDITERKQAEAALGQARDELAKSNEELERRVRQRTAELERVNAALLRKMEEEKRLEEQLRRAQKMESIGTLAGGIAHDFNNILNIIKGYGTLLGRIRSGDQELVEALKIINETIDRGASTVQQLLAIGRRSEAKLEQVDLNDVLERLGRLVSETFPKTIDIHFCLDPELPPVTADPNQIDQALLNICLNARDAMPEVGKLLLTTETVSRSELRERFPEAEQSQYALISIVDTGQGMDEAIKSRIFEPFFTTKDQSQGTGLGLSVVYGIVTRHRGFIDVTSRPGKGATFRIYLPIEQTRLGPFEIKRQVDPKKEDENILAEAHTILFVEDEERQLELMRMLLERTGYRVLTATDGAEAVEIHRRHKDEIAVVVLDLGLPKLNGWNAFQKMKEIAPTLKAILATGYISPEIESAMAGGEFSAVISKPYRSEDILKAVYAVAMTTAAPVDSID